MMSNDMSNMFGNAGCLGDNIDIPIEASARRVVYEATRHVLESVSMYRTWYAEFALLLGGVAFTATITTPSFDVFESSATCL